jgi:glucosylceramidase
MMGFPVMLNLLIAAMLLASLHVASASLSPVSVFATVPLNPALRFTRLSPLAFNASLCSSPPIPSTPVITVRPSARLQPFIGAGAALTEATAYNFLRLKERNSTAYYHLLHLLFAAPMRGGIGLNMLRFPITASDMSLPTPGGGWSFDDFDGDVNLTHFNTKRADEYQIPALLDILEVARREGNERLRLFAAPWSIPAWMKDTKLWTNGTLREELYDVYARYLAMVVQTFHDLNAPFWAITLQSQRSRAHAVTQQPQPLSLPR